MTTALGGKTVYVLFPFGERELARDSFFRTNVRELAARPRSAVVVVSPFWIRAKGLSEGGFYAHLRREDVAIYLVRRHYFFSLRKNVLTRCDGRVILIY